MSNNKGKRRHRTLLRDVRILHVFLDFFKNRK